MQVGECITAGGVHGITRRALFFKVGIVVECHVMLEVIWRPANEVGLRHGLKSLMPAGVLGSENTSLLSVAVKGSVQLLWRHGATALFDL